MILSGGHRLVWTVLEPSQGVAATALHRIGASSACDDTASSGRAILRHHCLLLVNRLSEDPIEVQWDVLVTAMIDHVVVEGEKLWKDAEELVAELPLLGSLLQSLGHLE